MSWEIIYCKFINIQYDISINSTILHRKEAIFFLYTFKFAALFKSLASLLMKISCGNFNVSG